MFRAPKWLAVALIMIKTISPPLFSEKCALKKTVSYDFVLCSSALKMQSFLRDLKAVLLQGKKTSSHN